MSTGSRTAGSRPCRYWPGSAMPGRPPNARPVPVHYLRPNEAEWTPADVVFFDTETAATDVEGGELHRPVIWCGIYRQRRTRNKALRSIQYQTGTDGADFADWLDATARRSKTTWAWAHNLAFDATALHIPVQMARRGWRLTEFSTNDACPFFRLSLTDHSLLLTDSYGWLPVALQAVGEAVGREKPPLPPADGPREALEARCRADTAILADAVCALLDWWDRERLGRFSLTGASCGWNAYRHRTKGRQVVIDPDPEARALERQALYGGRREAFRIGRWDRGRWLEMDLRNAYPTAAAHFSLPAKRVARFDSLPLDHAYLRAPNYGVIAQAVVTVTEPSVPLRWRKQVWYPVGTFPTVLASPELEPLIAAGKVQSIGAGYAYRTTPHMAPWARWIIDLCNGRIDDTPKVAQLVAKHWSRAVIGKWAGRTSSLDRWGPSPIPGWHQEDGWHATYNCPAAVVDIAGTRWGVIKNLEGDNTFPAVTVWVESLVRRALNTVMGEFSSSVIVQCDTDGMLIDDTTASELRLRLPAGLADRNPVLLGRDEEMTAAVKAAAPWELVQKSEHEQLEILGPVHWRTDIEQHYSGIPRGAVETEPRTFTYMTWPKLAWQMEHGRPDGYLRAPRTVKLAGPYTHRWVLADGSTLPVTAGMTPDGAATLLPWHLTPAGNAGLELDPEQHPLLLGLGL